MHALARDNPTAWLLANREHLSLTRATNYLVGRMRTRTPLGAAEFLVLHGDASTADHSSSERRDAFETRTQLALTKMEIYRSFFPSEYRSSESPAYSYQRERELYELIQLKLFPIKLELLPEMPGAFLPGIPIAGTQQHDWEGGCCSFDQLQTVFKLVLVLTGRKGPRGWRLLPLDIEPVAPLGAEAWTLFVYSIAVERTPLRSLIDAFNLTCYSTGNPWLDGPTDACVMVPWSSENVTMLAMACIAAADLNHQVMKLNRWLDESPKERLGRAVGLWNDAQKQAGEGVRVWRAR